MLKKICIIFSIILLINSNSFADSITIDQILDKGEIRVGFVSDVPPYGILDKDGKPAGFDAVFARTICDNHLKVKCNFVDTTLQNRIPYLETEKIDVMIGVMALTTERAKRIWYSNPYGGASNVVIAKKSESINSVDDLKGKSVGVVRGSTQDRALTSIASKEVKITRYDDDATAVQAFLTGLTDIHTSGHLTYKELNKLNPGNSYENKFKLTSFSFGIGIKKGNIDLLQYFNAVIHVMKNNGELDSIFRKTLEQPMPSDVRETL